MKSSSGSFELENPRDRSGTVEPQLVKKHQAHVSDEIETKILSMFGLGMSYRDMAAHVQEYVRDQRLHRHAQRHYRQDSLPK